MSIVEETFRGVSRRSKHGSRGGTTGGADWSATGTRGPAQPAPTSSATSSAAFSRAQDTAGLTRRQSSRESVDSSGQHTPPDHADLLFKVLSRRLIPVSLLPFFSRTLARSFARLADTLARYANFVTFLVF